MNKQNIYRVIFINQGQTYEVYVRKIESSSLFGFVEIEQLLFGEKSQVVVDPTEEKLKSEFEGVNKTIIPVHSVVRIDQVDNQGKAKIRESSGVVTHFPYPVGRPPGKQDH